MGPKPSKRAQNPIPSGWVLSEDKQYGWLVGVGICDSILFNNKIQIEQGPETIQKQTDIVVGGTQVNLSMEGMVQIDYEST